MLGHNVRSRAAHRSRRVRSSAPPRSSACSTRSRARRSPEPPRVFAEGAAAPLRALAGRHHARPRHCCACSLCCPRARRPPPCLSAPPLAPRARVQAARWSRRVRSPESPNVFAGGAAALLRALAGWHRARPCHRCRRLLCWPCALTPLARSMAAAGCAFDGRRWTSGAPFGRCVVSYMRDGEIRVGPSLEGNE